MTSEPPSDAAVLGSAELADAVQRATAAGIPVAVVELRGSGEPLAPSRGQPGARYGREAISIRELTLQGSGALDAGVVLYPPPGDDVKRVIVVPHARGNWVAFSESAERAVAQAAEG